jgi:hypothetical protein
MKQNSAILISMLLLALILAGAQVHALVMAHHGTPDRTGLKASVIETIEHLNDRRRSEAPPVPGLRGVPETAIN